MKTPVYKIISLMAFLFVFGFSGIAQTYADDDEEKDENEELAKINAFSPEVFRSLGIDNSPNPRNAQISGNTVFLQQIGDFNRAAVVAITDASEIKIAQNGDENFTFLGYRTRTAVTDILQNGISNDIIDFVYNPGADISLDLVQDGNDLYFERFGSNSITESLKFRQTEASPTVIIRSFQ